MKMGCIGTVGKYDFHVSSHVYDYSTQRWNQQNLYKMLILNIKTYDPFKWRTFITKPFDLF